MFLNVNLRLIITTLPMLPSHVSSPCLRITFQLHMACYKFYIVLYCIDISLDKEELIKFWRSSASGSGRSINFWKDSSTLEMAYFHNLLISPIKMIASSIKF